MKPRPLSMQEVGAWLEETGASLHMSFRDGKFLLVAHVAATDAHADLMARDLDQGLKRLMAEF